MLRLGGVWPPGRKGLPVAGSLPEFDADPGRVGPGSSGRGCGGRSSFIVDCFPYRCVAVGRRGRAAGGTRTKSVLHTGTVTLQSGGDRLPRRCCSGTGCADRRRRSPVRISADAEAWAVAHYAREADLVGYRGLAVVRGAGRRSRSEEITVSEIALLPGTDSLLARPGAVERAWVVAGDLTPGDVLANRRPPAGAGSSRYRGWFRAAEQSTDPDDVAQAIGELGLGRNRLLSREGRDDAAALVRRRVRTDDRWRWRPIIRAARAASTFRCRVHLRANFGVRANGGLGRRAVVSAEYGCSAHSVGSPRRAYPGRPRSRPMTTVRWRSCPPRRAQSRHRADPGPRRRK